MRIQPTAGRRTVFQQTQRHLLHGDIVKTAAKQVDPVSDTGCRAAKTNHRVSYRFNKELDMNVMHIVDNATGETVKQSYSDAQIDHMIRMRRLTGLHMDKLSL